MKRILNSKLLTEKLFKYNFFKKEVQQCKKWNQNLGVLCPICNSSFEIFENFGVTKRANARCKNCGSLERHRLLYFYLTEKFNMFKDKNKPTRILHFAPEKMFFDKFVKNEAVQYTPCDLHPKKYNFDGKTKVLKVDITNIPFEDNSFDFILCNHVLEHIPRDIVAMSELYRVMSKNGNGIFQVPIDYERTETYEDWRITSKKGRKKAFGQKDHVRWYGQDYKKRLQSVGFLVKEIDYVSDFTREQRLKFGLQETELIYHCKKPSAF